MPYSSDNGFCLYFKELRLNYLSFGGHVEYGLIRLGKFRIDALAGLNTSYLASAYVAPVNSQNPWDILSKQNFLLEEENSLRRFIFGLNTGSALSYSLGDTQIQARGTYYLGLNEVVKPSGLKSRSILLSLGIARTIR
jgi:hypothetical protein